MLASYVLKGRFPIFYKKTECRLFNLKYIVMASVMLKNISFIREQVEKREDINLSDANRSKIANWLWNN